jgi:curved DNA-binding protein CbpA
MDIKRCFEILELDRAASPDEVNQAYKDIVNVWHPDRFSNNPRLNHKAGEKLKEINIAYETLKSYLSSKQALETEQETTRAREDVDTGVKTQDEGEYRRPRQDSKDHDKTEALVEAGTGIVLSLWSYFSSVCQRIIADVKTEIEQEEPNQHQRKPGGRGDGKGRGTGTGGGMGRDGGGRGTGRG